VEGKRKKLVSKVADAVVRAKCEGGKGFEGAFAKMLTQRLCTYCIKWQVGRRYHRRL